MLGKDLIKFIKDHKMQKKDVYALICDGLFVTSFDIDGLEVSDPQTDDCTFVKVIIRPKGPYEEKCRECWIYLHPEVYSNPLNCWGSCKKKRHIKPTKKEKDTLKKL